MAGTRPLRFTTLESGCFVPTSHKLNKDGYFRKRWSTIDGENVIEMFHRFIYRAHFGDIPEGMEVDHLCRQRDCCNPNHLQLLTRREHCVKTNIERYAERRERALAHWEETQCSGTLLGKTFGVSYSVGGRWIREWRKLA